MNDLTLFADLFWEAFREGRLADFCDRHRPGKTVAEVVVYRSPMGQHYCAIVGFIGGAWMVTETGPGPLGGDMTFAHEYKKEHALALVPDGWEVIFKDAPYDRFEGAGNPRMAPWDEG